MVRAYELRTHSIYQPGSEVVHSIVDAVSVTYRRSVRIQENECTLTLLANSDSAAVVDHGHVFRIIKSVGHEEWLVDDIDTQVDGLKIVTCRHLILKLAEPAAVRTIVTATGLPNFRFALTNVLPANILQTYVRQPMLDAGEQWLQIGNVQFITPLAAFEWERQKPLGIADLLAAHPELVGELGLTDTGSAYELDLVKTLNGSLASVPVRFRKNLDDVRRQTRGVDFFTVIEPAGDQAPDGTPGTMAYNGWKVVAKPGGNLLQLADPLGGDPPIQYDGQFGSSHYLFRYLRGSSQQIVNSIAPDLIQVPNDAHYVINEIIELRAGAPSLEAIDFQQTFGDQRTPSRITAVNGGTRTVTLDQPFSNGDPLTKDNGYQGWNARILSQVLTTTVTSFTVTTMKLRVPAVVTSVQIGDRVFITSNPVTGAPPWAPLTTHFAARVDAIDTVNKDLTLSILPQYGGFTSNLSAGAQVSIWRQDALTEIDSCLATNTAVLRSVTGAGVNDLIEIFRYVDGKMLTELTAPSQVAIYGRRVGPLEVGGPTNNQFAPNGYYGSWPGGANALPEGYDAATSTVPLGSLRVNGIGEVVHGAFSARLRRGAVASTIISSNGQPLLNVGTTVLMVPGSVLRVNPGQPTEETITVLAITGPQQVQCTANLAFFHANNENVLELGANGAQASPSGIATMATPAHVIAVPAANSSVWFQAHVKAFGANVGQRAEIRVIGTGGAVLGSAITSIRDQFVTIGCTVQMNPGQRFHVEVRTNPTTDSSQFEAWVIVDALNWTIATYQPERFAEFPLGTKLHQAANDRLPATAFLPGIWQIQVADLAETFPDETLIEGGSITLTDQRLGALGITRRILSVSGSYDQSTPTQLELETDQQAMTRLMATARVATPQVVVKVDPASTGPVPGVTATITSVLKQQPLQFGGLTQPSAPPIAPRLN